MFRVHKIHVKPFVIVLACVFFNALHSLPHENPCSEPNSSVPENDAHPRCAAFSPIIDANERLEWNSTANAFEIHHATAGADYNRELFPSDEIRHCLQRKNVLFVGNSHLRLLVVQLLEAFGIDTRPLVQKRHASHAFYVSETETWIVFLWSTFSIKKSVSEYIAGYTDERESHYPRDFDLVVSNRGAWDMLYHDRLPPAYYQSVVDDMRALQTSFARSNVVFMNMNAFHTPNRKEMTDPQKTHRIERCFCAERLDLYRAMHECALQHVNGWDTRRQRADPRVPLVWLLDTYALTKPLKPHWLRGRAHVADAMLRNAVSNDGHHYIKEVNDVFVKVLLRFFCGEGAGSPHMLSARALATNCAANYRKTLQHGLNQTLCKALHTSLHGGEFHAFHEKYSTLCSNADVYTTDEKIHMHEHIF